ncbi:hypothetical protein C488_05002 [Natrinema pellirubrum DSM 15624]|nr:PH domain-containing protein [Natrinema pellirubrum]ELY79031.1 hypothetical protein C488_05002 [Natrinema pellirubrum DSM 15624]
MNRLHPSVRVVWGVKWILFGVGVGIVTSFVTGFDTHVISIVTVTSIIGIAVASLRYRAFRYELRDDGIYLRRGILTQKETVIPVGSVQQIDVDKPLLDRPFGLVHVQIYTAGTFGGRSTIPGIKLDTAIDLANRLDRLARGNSDI